MTNRPAAVTALALTGAVVSALVVAEIGLHLHTGYTDLTSWWVGSAILAITLLVPGLLIAAKRPDNAVGWLLLAASLSSALTGAGREYLVFGVLGGPAPGYLWIGWFTDAAYFLAMCVLPAMLMLFPDGRPLSRRLGWLLVFPAAAAILGTVGQLFTSDNAVNVRGHLLVIPARGVLPGWLSDSLTDAGVLVFFASVVLAILVIVLRYRRSGSDVRQQMKWVVWAGSLGALELVTELIPGNQISEYTGPMASALLSAAVCVAILRHRLLDIDVVINRTLVYVLLSISVFGLYVAVVAVASAAFDRPLDIGHGLVATVVVALTFGPVRSLLQHGVDRLMYGQRRNPYGVMSRLGRDLERTSELVVVAQTVAQALKLPYAAIVDPDGRMLAEVGECDAEPAVWALSYQGVEMGQLLALPSRGQARFTRDEHQLLDDLSRQVGAAVHAVRLSADLRASRTRLVSAKEEERRRLRRDLHDGLGPKLAALGLKIEAAHALADAQPEASKALMSTIKDDIRTTIDDIRQLVYGLRPPALDELGLVGALREATGRFEATAGAPRIVLDAPAALPPLPAAVEVAAYRIVTEAVTNTVRHAQATRCRVKVSLSGDRAVLCLTVSDDGVGLPGGWRPGVGTSSMRERAEELGGQLVVQAMTAGGTEASARIPCGATA